MNKYFKLQIIRDHFQVYIGTMFHKSYETKKKLFAKNKAVFLDVELEHFVTPPHFLMTWCVV